MITFIEKKRSALPYRLISLIITVTFLSTLITPVPSYAQSVFIAELPAPGVMLPISPGYTPALIRGVTIFPENPLEFDFIIDRGESGLDDQAIRGESLKMVKYFLAALTVPEDELWVNLSPYEKDRIIPESFSVTGMGRDLLAQDYVLKQLTASLMYPEDELGQKFWERVYARARELFGTTEIPINTFNKVWIVPDKAVVFEHGATAFVAESHLKVMLEEDYLALKENLGDKTRGMDQLERSDAEATSTVSSSVVKEVLIPEIEKEVNEGKNFAVLRQIYDAVILATWYKKNLKESLLGKIYVDQNKIKGIDIEDKQAKEKIYKQYVEAFKKGVYDFIKEDYDAYEERMIPRRYFSGGAKIVPDATAYSEVQDDLTRLSPRGKDNMMATAKKPTHDRVKIRLAEPEEKVALAQAAKTRRDRSMLTELPGFVIPEELLGRADEESRSRVALLHTDGSGRSLRDAVLLAMSEQGEDGPLAHRYLDMLETNASYQDIGAEDPTVTLRRAIEQGRAMMTLSKAKQDLWRILKSGRKDTAGIENIRNMGALRAFIRRLIDQVAPPESAEVTKSAQDRSFREKLQTLLYTIRSQELGEELRRLVKANQASRELLGSRGLTEDSRKTTERHIADRDTRIQKIQRQLEQLNWDRAMFSDRATRDANMYRLAFNAGIENLPPHRAEEVLRWKGTSEARNFIRTAKAREVIETLLEGEDLDPELPALIARKSEKGFNREQHRKLREFKARPEYSDIMGMIESEWRSADVAMLTIEEARARAEEFKTKIEEIRWPRDVDMKAIEDDVRAFILENEPSDELTELIGGMFTHILEQVWPSTRRAQRRSHIIFSLAQGLNERIIRVDKNREGEILVELQAKDVKRFTWTKWTDEVARDIAEETIEQIHRRKDRGMFTAEQRTSMLERAGQEITAHLTRQRDRKAITQGVFEKSIQATIPALKRWAEDEYIERVAPGTRDAIFKAIEDRRWVDLDEAFRQEISFGTAGIRGKAVFSQEDLKKMQKDGARASILKGPNTINDAVILRYTTGVIRDMKAKGEKEVVIGYDSRIAGAEFAELIARCFIAQSTPDHEFKIFLFDEASPFPELSFGQTTRKVRAKKGILMSASHNPSQYNGYKITDEKGSQLPQRKKNDVVKAIEETSFRDIKVANSLADAKPGQLVWLGGDKPIEGKEYYGAPIIDMHKEHVEQVGKFILDRDVVNRQGSKLKIGFAAFNGSGNKAVPRILRENGFTDLKVISSLQKLDGTFPAFGWGEQPDPGDPISADIAVREFVKEHGQAAFDELDILIGTDPDADRMGLIVKVPEEQQDIFGKYRLLSANDVWTLLTWYRLKRKQEMGLLEDPQKHYVTFSHVTTDAIEKAADLFDVRSLGEMLDTTETQERGGYLAGRRSWVGFTYIADFADKMRQKGLINEGGMEESNGYSILGGAIPEGEILAPDAHVNDKDGALAGVLMAEVAAYAKENGTTIFGLLDDLFKKIGHYATANKPLPRIGQFDGAEGHSEKIKVLKQAQAWMKEANDKAGTDTPFILGGRKVIGAVEFKSGRKEDEHYEGFPDEGVRFFFEDPALEKGADFTKSRSHITIRPSGTSATIRFYTQMFSDVSGLNEEEFVQKKHDGYVASERMSLMAQKEILEATQLARHLPKVEEQIAALGDQAMLTLIDRSTQLLGHIERLPTQPKLRAAWIARLSGQTSRQLSYIQDFDETRRFLSGFVEWAQERPESRAVTQEPSTETVFDAFADTFAGQGPTYQLVDLANQNPALVASVQTALDVLRAQASVSKDVRLKNVVSESMMRLAQPGAGDRSMLTLNTGAELAEAFQRKMVRPFDDVTFRDSNKIPGVDDVVTIRINSITSTPEGEIINTSVGGSIYTADVLGPITITQQRDRAMMTGKEEVGGIDLNPELLDLQIKRDTHGVPLPLPQQPIETIKIEGLTPVIINITPITDMPFIIGVGEGEEEPTETSSGSDQLVMDMTRKFSLN